MKRWSDARRSPVDILYRDDRLAAVYKPAGMLVHPSRIDRRAGETALQAARAALGQPVYTVHRLDRPTSGVLLLALAAETARRLGPLFAGGAVTKSYLAVVRGWTSESGVIDYPLVEAQDPTTDALADAGKPAQSAVTTWRRLATAELPGPVGRYATARYSLLEVQPRTGRRHQIRRHLKHVFHPLVGDTTHGDGNHNRHFRVHLRCERLLLHAWKLAFAHPHTGMALAITAPPDAVLQRVYGQLGWEAIPGSTGERA